MSKGLTKDEVQIYLWAFIGAIFFLILLEAIGNPYVKERYEFFAYAFPCAAVVIAGGNFYLSNAKSVEDRDVAGDSSSGESSEANFYLGSVILVFFGLIFQSKSSRCSSQAIVLVALILVVVSASILIGRTVNSARINGVRRERLGIAILICVLLLVIWSAWELGLNLHSLFVPNGKLFICVG